MVYISPFLYIVLPDNFPERINRGLIELDGETRKKKRKITSKNLFGKFIECRMRSKYYYDFSDYTAKTLIDFVQYDVMNAFYSGKVKIKNVISRKYGNVMATVFENEDDIEPIIQKNVKQIKEGRL